MMLDRPGYHRLLPKRVPDRTVRAATRAELEAQDYALEGRLNAFKDQVDSESLADAMTVSLEEEITLLDYGLSLAGTSAVKQELVRQKVLRVNQINNRRIVRRFSQWT